jgi:hypothetical protein
MPEKQETADVDKENLMETLMKRTIFATLTVLAAVISCNAHAWTYIEIDSKGNARYLDKTPVDLTYPPDNVRMPVVDANDHSPPQGTPLTAQQERRRMSGESLIIVDGSMARGEGWGISAKEQPLH